MSALFVFAADLHLCDRLWVGRPGIFGDAYFSFEQIIEYCVAESLPLVLGGDILDKERNFARPIQVLCRQLDIMRDAQLPVYYIQGQHERNYDATWLGIHPWPQHVHKQQFSINGCKIYALDWCPRSDIKQELAAVPPDTEILVCHQVWKDLMGNVGRPECALSDVHVVRNVLTGDFHVTTMVDAPNAGGDLARLISPGSTCLRSVNEPPKKNFYVVHDSPGDNFGKHTFEVRELRTRPIRIYTVSDVETLDALCAGDLLQHIAEMRSDLPDHIAKPIVRIKYNTAIPDAYLRLSTVVGDSAHLFCDPIVEKKKATSKTVNTAADLLEAVLDILGAESAQANFAQALLHADDPAAEIERQFKSFVEEEQRATAEPRS